MPLSTLNLPYFILSFVVFFCLSSQSQPITDAESFKKSVLQSQASSINDLSQWLIEQSNTSRWIWSGVFDSQDNNQHTSFENPRLVWTQFDKSRDTFISLAFSHKDFNSQNSSQLQAIVFNNQTKNFELLEAYYGSNKKWTFSQTNPSQCLSCHQSARPLWQAYPHTPGVYRGLHNQTLVAKNYGLSNSYSLEDRKWKKYKRTALINEKYYSSNQSSIMNYFNGQRVAQEMLDDPQLQTYSSLFSHTSQLAQRDITQALVQEEFLNYQALLRVQKNSIIERYKVHVDNTPSGANQYQALIQHLESDESIDTSLTPFWFYYLYGQVNKTWRVSLMPYGHVGMGDAETVNAFLLGFQKVLSENSF